jgi:Zn-dependent protease with chaperone function
MSVSTSERRKRRNAVGGRSVDGSAISAFVPVLAVLPMSLLALFLFWLPVQLVWSISFGWFVAGYIALGVLLFLRPVQALVLMPLLGAHPPTADQRAQIDVAWRSVLQANALPPRRYVLGVLPADELNAFACGGHLVIVTSFAIAELPRDELSGVLAHELSHHLGLHTVALTISHWLAAPVLLMARIGFFLQSVATAATTSFARNSASFTALGKLITALLTAISWVFLSGLLVTNFIANASGRNAEFEADRRAVDMGFGRPLASALRRVLPLEDHPTTRLQRLAASHPSSRTRIARIDAYVRRLN